MNEIQKPKPNRRWSRLFVVWLIFFAGFVIIVSNWLPSHNRSFYFGQALIPLVGSTFMLGLWCLIRWCCQPRRLGRFLVGAACFATITAIFYMEENWRGKRAWEQCKAELEAKGFVMDWDKYIPAPVPDDQNFFTANTNILLRFERAQIPAQGDAAAKMQWLRLPPLDSNSFPLLNFTKSQPVVVAELSFVPSAKAGSIAKFDDPTTRNQIHDLLKKTIGRSIAGAAGYQFSEFQLTNLTPAKMVLQADTPPSAGELESFISPDLATNIGRLKVSGTTDTGIIQVLLTNVPGYMQMVCAVADYLKWSDQFVPAFDDLREALKRPYAIIPGDYSRPYLMPIPNFITMRGVAQTLAQRAQCDFLLGKPDEALHELTLIHDLCRILQKPPTGKPETLIESMINVAIDGLYTSTIADGFRLHVWQEPQMAALQEQLQTINLPRYVAESMHEEVASSAHTLEICTPSELYTFLNNRNPLKLWEKVISPELWLLYLVPRGWYYQNMAASARISENNADTFDLSNNMILPGASEASSRRISEALRHWSFWNFWATIAIPNLTKAAQSTAYNQTLANEAQVACALERYHLAHGEYPATLDALVPQFAAELPHDIIGGQPLHYRQLDNGRFLLYSVGWNETDDGGVPGTLSDVKKDDWVWRQ